jgi:hypothetical protein
LVHHSTIFEMNVESRISSSAARRGDGESEIDAARAAARDPTKVKPGAVDGL